MASLAYPDYRGGIDQLMIAAFSNQENTTAVMAAIEAAKADQCLHTNERIYQNGYVDGLQAALDLITKS
jgi:hypothetical protein